LIDQEVNQIGTSVFPFPIGKLDYWTLSDVGSYGLLSSLAFLQTQRSQLHEISVATAETESDLGIPDGFVVHREAHRGDADHRILNFLPAV